MNSFAPESADIYTATILNLKKLLCMIHDYNRVTWAVVIGTSYTCDEINKPHTP